MPFSQSDQLGILTAIARHDPGLAADIIEAARGVPRPYKVRVLKTLVSANGDTAEVVQLVTATDTSVRHRDPQPPGMPPTEPLFDVAAGVDPEAIPPSRIGEPQVHPGRPPGRRRRPVKDTPQA